MTETQKLDPRNPLVVDTHDLGRRAGNQELLTRTVPAPADLGLDLIGVPEGSDIDLDLRLESVLEGVLVTGRAVADLDGECSRCLTLIEDEIEIDLTELFSYEPPEQEDDENETRVVVDELIDLEPALRDAIVLDLPLQPLCRPDCLGLCPDCGANLNDDPSHGHDAPVDPRLAGLASLLGPDSGDGDSHRA